MPAWLKVGFSQLGALAAAGLVLGVSAAWVGLLAADGPANVAGVVAQVYPLLALLLPVVLLTLNWRRSRSLAPLPSVGALLVAATLGAVLAHFGLIVACTNIPALFGGESAVAMSRALPPAIGLARFGLVLAATLLSAAVLAARALARPA